MIFVDDKTRIFFVKFLKARHEASPKAIELFRHWHNAVGRYPSRVKSDATGDFAKLRQKMEPKGVIFEPTPPRTPDQNGTAEQVGGYVIQTARAMMHDTNLPKTLWPFAVETAIHILNRLVRDSEIELAKVQN